MNSNHSVRTDIACILILCNNLFFCDKIFFTDSFVNKREGQIKYGDR